jgi:putative DNA primase/helicase
VDDAVKMHRGMGTPTDLPPDPEPWESEVDGADLLDDLTNATREYLILRKGLAETVALWVVFTHCHNAFEVSPVLAITSPTPECGKTSLLTLLGELAPRPLPAANITGPAFFRAVDAWTPTVLIDEADTFLRDRDELRGILNSGHNRRNAWIVRTQGEEHDPRRSRLGRLRPSL